MNMKQIWDSGRWPTSQEMRDFYEAIAQQGHSNQHIDQKFLRTQLALDNMDPGDVVLEVGCQDGGISQHIAQRSGFLTIMDIAPTFVQKAAKFVSERAPGAAFEALAGDVMTFETDRKYDLIVATEIIEHVPDPRAMVRRLVKMLARDGKLVMTTPHGYTDTLGEHIHDFSARDMRVVIGEGCGIHGTVWNVCDCAWFMVVPKNGPAYQGRHDGPFMDIALICQDEIETLPWLFTAVETLYPNLGTVVAVDGGSTDGTLDLLEKWKSRLPIHIVQHELDDFASQRNRAIDCCTAEYIMRADADTTFGSQLRDEMVRGALTCLINDFPVYWTVRDAYHYLPDKGHGGVASVVFKNQGLRYVRPVHEYLVMVGEENPPDRLAQVRYDWENVRSKPLGLQILPIPLFHHAYRKSDEALRDSAQKYARFAEKSRAAGIPIPTGDDEWRVRAKHKVLSEFQIDEFPDEIRRWIIPNT